jgi:hypothetical protein
MNKKVILSVVISALLFSGTSLADSLPSSLSIISGGQSHNSTSVNGKSHDNAQTSNNEMSIPKALEPTGKNLLTTNMVKPKTINNKIGVQNNIVTQKKIAPFNSATQKTEANDKIHLTISKRVNNKPVQNNKIGALQEQKIKSINVSRKPVSSGRFKQASKINSTQQTSANKNIYKPTLAISNDNPFTGSSSEKAKLTSDYNLWQAKTKIVSTMVKFQKQMNALKQLKAEGGNIPSSSMSSGNASSNPAIKKLEHAIMVMQLTINKQNEAIREKETAANNAKKLLKNKPKLISTITYNDKLLAVIKVGSKISSYGVNSLVGSSIIQEITPDSVTFTSGKVIDIPQYNTGYIEKAAWIGYPKKNGSRSQSNTVPVANKIPTFPHNNVEPFNVPNSTLPSMR